MTGEYFANARGVKLPMRQRRCGPRPLIAESLKALFHASEAVKARLPALEALMADGRRPVVAAAKEFFGG